MDDIAWFAGWGCKMKRQRITCAEKKKRYGSQPEYKRAVKETLRKKAAMCLNREFKLI